MAKFFSLTPHFVLAKNQHNTKKEALPTCCPVLLSFCLDMSGSMDLPISLAPNATRWTYVANCVSTLVTTRRHSGHPDDMITITGFSDVAHVILAPCYLNEVVNIYECLLSQKMSGDTDISAGYEFTYRQLENIYKESSNSKRPRFVIQVDLTDGQANRGLCDANSLAQLKTKQIKSLETQYKIGIMLATYAISSGGNGYLPRLCAETLGSMQSIWRKLSDKHFMEFKQECALIYGLAHTLEQYEYRDNKFYLVRGTDWQLYPVANSHCNMSQWELALTLLLQQHLLDPTFVTMRATLRHGKVPPPSHPLPLKRTLADCDKVIDQSEMLPPVWLAEVLWLRARLQRRRLLGVFLHLLDELITQASETLDGHFPQKPTLLRATSSTSYETQEIVSKFGTSTNEN